MEQRTYTMDESEAHAQGPLFCAEGDTLVVELPSRPSTGYRWELESLPDGVTCTGESFRRKEGVDPEAVGGGGTELWNFKVRRFSHGATIKLSLRRVWEDEDAIRSCLVSLMPSES